MYTTEFQLLFKNLKMESYLFVKPLKQIVLKKTKTKSQIEAFEAFVTQQHLIQTLI